MDTFSVFTGRNKVVAKDMFLTCVCDSVHRGVSRQGEPPWQGGTPPGQGGTPPGRENPTPPQQGGTPPAGRNLMGRENPPDQTDSHLPPAGRNPPRQGESPGPGRPPPGSRLQNTAYERPVRILLECILVKSTSSKDCIP